jgi:hypothetical protein
VLTAWFSRARTQRCLGVCNLCNSCGCLKSPDPALSGCLQSLQFLWVSEISGPSAVWVSAISVDVCNLLTNEMRRIGPQLRSRGLFVSFDRTREKRLIVVRNQIWQDRFGHT